MAKRSRIPRDEAPSRAAALDDGSVDDAASLGVVAASQTASGLPQGIAAMVVVYALVRLGRLVIGSLRGDRPARS